MVKPKALLYLAISGSIAILGCRPEPPPEATAGKVRTLDTLLTKAQLADKVLGMLVGSAIGDAMGAPTEMWDRTGIRTHYGHIDTLDPLIREASPEGPWSYNLAAGGTTDDTRWKILTAGFLRQSPADADTLDATAFSRYIIDHYLQYIEGLKATEGFEAGPYEQQARQMTWLQEWALVARPYAEGDHEGYLRALNRFYGGEMVCAGLLYSPLIGIYYAGVPDLAYREAYRLGIFDHGYARDITGLAAALTAAAAGHRAGPENCLAVVRDIDPYHFFESRLLGRSAFRIFQEAQRIAYQARQYRPSQADLEKAVLPAGWKSAATDFLQRERAYELMAPRLQDAPFHAGEIWLVTLTGIQFGEWEFLPTLEFITNFGRDSDTSGAVAGAVLGAYHGADALPPGLRAAVLQVNREMLGIDLEKTAGDLTEAIWKRHT